MKKLSLSFLLLSALLVFSCQNAGHETEAEPSAAADTLQAPAADPNYLTDFEPLSPGGNVNAVVEIPAGTLEKWEVDKSDGKLKLEMVDAKPRIVNYLGYPGNYGMIPGTLLPSKLGGDGDPLDVILLGPPIERGQVVECKVIGVLKLLDRGEQDDKLIAVIADTPLFGVNSIEDLKTNYPGAAEIIQWWFTNYKGPGMMESKGFAEREEAMQVLETAIGEYRKAG